MGFEQLDQRILIDLQSNNTKECLYIIKNNREIINKYLGDNADLNTIQSYVKKLNYIILHNNPQLSFIETMLNLPYYNRVYSVFLNSEILIEACRLGRRETLEWLLTFNINPHVRDKRGMTAIMHASKNPDLLFVLKKLTSTTTSIPQNDNKIGNDNSGEMNVNDNNNQKNSVNKETSEEVDGGENKNGDFENHISNNDNYSILNEEDDQGRNVLFHSVRNISALKELLKMDVEINHLNKNHESVLIYCCKNKYYEAIQYLTQHPDLDVNLTDQREWTAAMYLAEKVLKKMYWPEGEDEDRETCSSYYSTDTFSDNASSINSETSSTFSYNNPPRYSSLSSYRDSILSTCVNRYTTSYQPYIYLLTHFIHRGFNFNLPMDDDGNTPLMLIIIVGDIQTLHYVINCSDKVDLSAKNKYGENAYTLALKYNLPKGILDEMKYHLTFDYDYYDEYTGNNLFLLSAMMEPQMIKTIIQREPKAIDSVNPHRKENALILATKLHRKDSVQTLLQYSIPIDYQDALGNTALYYAIDGNDIHIVKLLRSNNADMNIKNKTGISPMDYAKSLGYDYMLNILKEERKSVLFSFPSPPTSPKMNQELNVTSTTEEDEKKEKKESPSSPKEKRKSHAKKSSKSKSKKEEVKDFYFQFIEEDEQTEEKFKETTEYIQPHVGTYYADLELDLPVELILAERKVYNEEVIRSRSLLKLCHRNSTTSSIDTDYDYNFNNIPAI
ncbi:hypothetical protein PIROE2DRAFT_16370 [Piromyces sp. E2]|nr:hypothetical protein PIROE2DRAFT_16370 [Piromyces sp. E2]|eukprot:OUM58383.1 hypothetical protein PIROE2DRAFT_16370 [Piromyces sp. E2]